MSGHTPGPLTAKELGGSFDEPRWVILWPDKSKGGVHMRRLDDHGEFDKEDAQVMAAAPELLEALELLLDGQRCRITMLRSDGLLPTDKARAAIAKAKGEA